MTTPDYTAIYQWNYRPQQPARPDWFTSWPGGAKLALMIILLNEWESRPAPVRPMPAGAHHTFDYLALGHREYGARFGVWRLLDVLDKHGVKATMICSGLLAELFPETVRAARERGHEIATHGWDQSAHPPTFATAEEEWEVMQRAVAAIEQAAGGKIAGYMSQGPRPTPNTLELVARHGFTWDADYSDSDVPYTIDVNGQKIVSVGYVAPNFTDNTLAELGTAAGLQLMKDAFDATYAEAARHPMKFTYSCHVHISGRPWMATILDELLAYAKQHEGVWFCRAIDLASFWLENERAAG